MHRLMAVPAAAAVVISVWGAAGAETFWNEPNGFGGIAWGTPFSAVQDQMIPMPGEGLDATQLFHRKGDKAKVGGVSLQDVAYVFDNGIFLGVVVTTKGLANRRAIISAFRAEFGEGRQPIESMDDYYWWGNTTSANLSCQLLVDECDGIIRSTVGLKQESANMPTATQAQKNF